jgi:hypothetical protein
VLLNSDDIQYINDGSYVWISLQWKTCKRFSSNTSITYAHDRHVTVTSFSHCINERKDIKNNTASK